MKKFLRATSALLLVALLICAFASCNNTDEGEVIPEGMKIANITGDDFRLFVPTDWNLNTAYGVAGAYYNLDTQSTVSMVKYPISEDLAATLPEGGDAEKISARIDAYAAASCKPAIDAKTLGGEAENKEEPKDTLLNGIAARQYHYFAKIKGENLHFLQVIGEKNEAFYVFTFTCHPDLYEALLPSVERMLDEFIFADPYLPDEYARKTGDAEAPAGMVLVSNDDVAYRFYAPESWEVSFEQEIFAAYCKEDRSSVSVIPYMPEEENMSVAQYFSICQNQMVDVGGAESFALISEEETKLGGRDATAYIYTYKIGDKIYQYKQIIAVYRSMLYSMTYTSVPENFEAHLDDVNAMVEAFAFR